MRFRFLILTLLISLSACQPSFETETPTISSITRSFSPEYTATLPINRSVQLVDPVEINSPTPDLTFTPSPTLTPSPTATPLVILPFLNGIVNEQSSCRYGPGAAYLFEWGLYPQDSVRILNRNWDGSWVYVKPNTYNNECWVKVSLLSFQGDVNSLEEYYSPLPYVYTYLYVPVKYVIVERNGDEVLISWDPVKMTEDDDRGYLIEAWVCQAGKFIFLPINIFPYTKTFAKIDDEPGCSQPSHARFYTVEKHGYMPYIEIPWPEYK